MATLWKQPLLPAERASSVTLRQRIPGNFSHLKRDERNSKTDYDATLDTNDEKFFVELKPEPQQLPAQRQRLDLLKQILCTVRKV